MIDPFVLASRVDANVSRRELKPSLASTLVRWKHSKMLPQGDVKARSLAIWYTCSPSGLFVCHQAKQVSIFGETSKPASRPRRVEAGLPAEDLQSRLADREAPSLGAGSIHLYKPPTKGGNGNAIYSQNRS